MRRLIAAFGLLALANLVFAQGGWSCPLGPGGHEGVATASANGGGAHDGHAADHSSPRDPAPAPDHQSPAPTCLTMGPCVIAVDITPLGLVPGPAPRADRLLAVSDHLPPSPAPAPELPPPRA